jgi:hypothetical protein
MESNLKSTSPKEVPSIARRDKYISFLERYSLYSTLLVLKDYEDTEQYEECAIIFSALVEFKSRYDNKIPTDVKFPTHLDMYNEKPYQDMMERLNIKIEEKSAKEKATLIKLNLPVKNEL